LRSRCYGTRGSGFAGGGAANHISARQLGKGPSMLISILITFLVVILILYLVNMLPIDGRAKQIIQIVVIIVGILSLLRYLGVGF
jgi:hypothetical protein